MMDRPTRDETTMYVAQAIAERGTCCRLRVGAVICRDGRILATGYNGAPAGMPHCEHEKGDDTPCEVTVHAEANAIAFAARHGVRTEGAELHTTHSPCLTCAKLIINAVEHGSAAVTAVE